MDGVEEKKDIKPVAQAKVAGKSHTRLQKVREQFVQDRENAADYIIFDVLIPAFKKTVWDLGTSALSLILGQKRPFGSGNGYGGATKYGYSSMYTGVQRVEKPSFMAARDTRKISQGGQDFDDLLFDSRGEAELVLDQLRDIMDRYQVVSVSDLYESCHLPAPHTANKYGWTALNGARIQRVPDGYLLIMPMATPL